MNQFFFNLRQKCIKPFHTGYLPEQDGHCIFFQQIGNPKGIPVISFHGGPGSESKPRHAAAFNLKKYHVILFDQRGCGKSTFTDFLYKNTAQEIIKDAARLLDYLNIKQKVIAAGGSAGSTWALLFAQTYPERVKALLINSIFLGRKKDAADMSPIAPFFYPDILDKFQQMAKKENQFDYFYRLLFSEKRADNEKALRYYGSFEEMVGGMDVSFDNADLSEEALRRFRIFMIYQKHDFYLKPNQILNDAKKIAHIPCRIYQNRLDFSCPPSQAFELAKALPNARLILLPFKGHTGPRLARQMYLDNLKDA